LTYNSIKNFFLSLETNRQRK